MPKWKQSRADGQCDENHERHQRLESKDRQHHQRHQRYQLSDNLLALNAAVEAAGRERPGGDSPLCHGSPQPGPENGGIFQVIQDIVSQNVSSTKKDWKLVNETNRFFAEIMDMLKQRWS